MVYKFKEAVKLALSKDRVFDYKSRSCRSEFWWFGLFNLLLSVGMYLVEEILSYLTLIFFFYNISILYFIFGLLSTLVNITFTLLGIFLFVASTIIAIRRLHDKDLTGWLQILAYIPILNLVTLVLYCLKGTEGSNKYGDDTVTNKIDTSNLECIFNYWFKQLKNFSKKKENKDFSFDAKENAEDKKESKALSLDNQKEDKDLSSDTKKDDSEDDKSTKDSKKDEDDDDAIFNVDHKFEKKD